MGRNLTNLYISQSFEYLVQISGSELQNGLGSTLTGSLAITSSKADTATSASFATTASYVASVVSASYAVSASYSNNSTSASYALVSTSSSFATNANSASYATNALSSSFAITASYALNAGTTVSTASLLTTASAAANIITFTKGDGSTFPVTIATGSAVSASFATTASLALNNVLTASVSSNTITFTKGDGTTFPITVNTGSAVTVNTGSLLVTASISNATTTFTKGDGSTFSITANNVVNANSASVATSASFATTASFASNIANGLSPTFANVTASNVLITGTASVALLYTQTVSSSVIYSSGSNQFGDAPDDVQTLYGTVDIKNGPVKITGSVTSTIGFTGSLLGTASFATSALSASYAISASQAQNAVSASYAPAGNPFPFTGSALITGSLGVTGSISTNSPETTLGNNSKDQVLVGRNAGKVLNSGGYNTLVGADRFGGTNGAGSNMTSPTENVAVGASAGQFITDGDQNTLVGTLAGYGANASQNTFVGYAIGQALAAGSNGNVAVGRWTGYDLNGQYNVLLGWRTGFETTGNSNIFLGPDINGQGAGRWTSSSYLAIGSSQVTSNNLLYGYHGTAQQRFLNVNGNLQVSQSLGVTGSINVLSGSFSGSAITNVGDIYTSSAAIQKIITLTQAEYNAIGSPNDNTLYIISGSAPFNSSAFATTGSNSFVGNQTVTGSVTATLGFTGSLLGTASFATFALGAAAANSATTASYALISTSASFATTASFTTSASFATTASFYDLSNVTQNAVFSGSIRGEVSALSISSQTASLDCATDNFFTLLLVSGSNTFVNPSNILPGQTINLRIKQSSVASGSISFASSIKQVSGSAYTPTATANGEDIVTFISFDSTNLYLSNIKNFV